MKRERGQAAVELALVLPVVALLLLLVVQAGLVVVGQVAVVQAAREGARRAALDHAPDAARRGALDGGLAPARTQVTEQRSRGQPATVTVEVVYRAPTDIPFVGPLLPDIELRADATMAVEAR